MRLGDGIQRFGADRIGIIHRDEPLRRRTEDHRLLGPPAMRIAMRELTRRGQRPRSLHRRINGYMRLEDMQALKPRRVMGEGAVVVHGFRDRQVMRAAQIEVILTMARRDMHKARARFGSDEITGQQLDGKSIPPIGWRPIRQRMRKPISVKFVPLQHYLDCVGTNSRILFELREQGQGNKQSFANLQVGLLCYTLDMQKRVINVWPIRDRAVARHGPRRSGPDHYTCT